MQTPPRLTTSEIVTALHCCNEGRTGCSSCPLQRLSRHGCMSILHESASNALVDSNAHVARLRAMLDDLAISLDSIRKMCK